MKTISDLQFKKYCSIIYREAGIYLTAEKRALLNSRLSKRIRKLGINPNAYLDLIEKDRLEMENFLDTISTNHTFFFRESKSFRYLDSSCKQIWCAASSSGEEAYSLAIYCLSQGFEPTILATDLSTICLKKCQRAIYPMERKSNIPDVLLRTYFQKGQGRWKGFIRVKANVQRIVHFERLNLITDAVPRKNFDAIFCRNVMIYFDNPTKEAVVRKICAVLKPHGYFIIGAAESLNGLNHGLKYLEPSVYQKR